MANAVLLGTCGKPPGGGGPNKHPALFKSGHGAGRQDCPEDPGIRQVKRGAFAAVTEPAEFPSRVESPKEPFWSKLLTIGTPKWSYMTLYPPRMENWSFFPRIFEIHPSPVSGAQATAIRGEKSL